MFNLFNLRDDVLVILTDRWASNGFKRLSEPADDCEGDFGIPLKIDNNACEHFTDFQTVSLEPALLSLERSVREADKGEFHQIKVTLVDDILTVISSRGEIQ